MAQCDWGPIIIEDYIPYHPYLHRWLGTSPRGSFDKLVTIKFNWLKERFMIMQRNAIDEVVERHTCVYLLYLVGSTIFASANGNEHNDEVRKVRVGEARAKRWRPSVTKKSPSHIVAYYHQEIDLLDSSKIIGSVAAI
ncbi:hypothetical protein AMTR_s00003p00223750 [Amborella trichopoda]|uniref:Aminotransferase-like plant mobile domain-containing protein n=1 Tax=Amborella trichopoda TaxID=13333 RepID=W1P8H9_AMBTC|nr:hypothetical protein AMTR_s00003p00223750 [Amborella trichopoda]